MESIKTSLHIGDSLEKKGEKQTSLNNLEISLQRDGNLIEFSAKLECVAADEDFLFEQCIALLRFQFGKNRSHIQKQLDFLNNRDY